MEVHAHSHTERKRWTHYFWEFIMLFLAVFCGFLAEYKLEHTIDKEKANQYVKTYRGELLQHQNVYADYKKRYQLKIVTNDSMKNIIFRHEENEKLETVKRLLVPCLTLIDIPFSTASYDQLVSSGSLRYLNNLALRDSMSAYRSLIDLTKAYNDRIIQSLLYFTFEVSRIQDLHDVISTDTTTSYDQVVHVPDIQPFENLSGEQRKLLAFFYESYIIQAQSNLRRIRRLEALNQGLLDMLNTYLGK
jgi:hypothetical protein